MLLTHRLPTLDDFLNFYSLANAHKKNPGLWAQVEHEGKVFAENPATLSLVVEDAEAAPGRRMVAFGQVVFVSDRFVTQILANPVPWVLVQATRTLDDGSWPLLSLDAVGAANSGAGLNSLTTRWAVAEAFLTDEQERLVNEYLWRSFLSLSRGYNFKEIFLETVGDFARERALHSGFHVRADYDHYFQAHPPDPFTDRPCLMSVTRAEAAQSHGTLISHLFSYLPPRFGFSRRSQDLLNWTLDGRTNEEFADIQGLTGDAVKKRWLKIYERVETVDGNLLPDERETDGRGREKRRRLLHYLREHPEELRPHRAKSGKVREAGSNSAYQISA